MRWATCLVGVSHGVPCEKPSCYHAGPFYIGECQMLAFPADSKQGKSTSGCGCPWSRDHDSWCFLPVSGKKAHLGEIGLLKNRHLHLMKKAGKLLLVTWVPRFKTAVIYDCNFQLSQGCRSRAIATDAFKWKVSSSVGLGVFTLLRSFSPQRTCNSWYERH